MKWSHSKILLTLPFEVGNSNNTTFNNSQCVRLTLAVSSAT